LRETGQPPGKAFTSWGGGGGLYVWGEKKGVGKGGNLKEAPANKSGFAVGKKGTKRRAAMLEKIPSNFEKEPKINPEREGGWDEWEKGKEQHRKKKGKVPH